MMEQQTAIQQQQQQQQSFQQQSFHQGNRIIALHFFDYYEIDFRSLCLVKFSGEMLQTLLIWQLNAISVLHGCTMNLFHS